jgi:hypothetical protein
LTSVFLRATLGARIKEVPVPKSDLPIGGEYARVADRIALFYERFPAGRIITQLTMHNEREVVFRASVFRTEKSRTPAATGWASERIGDGDINTVACLENTETSAIGRALANLGFTASKNRPSLEEMEKAERQKAWYDSDARGPTRRSARLVRERATSLVGEPLQRRADEIVQLVGLVDAAEREGLRSARARRLRDWLTGTSPTPETLARIRHHLRHWLVRQRRRRLGSPLGGSTPGRTITSRGDERGDVTG